MAKLERLSSPIEVGSLTLRNKMIMTSMAPGGGYATQDGKPTERLYNFLEERARGGTALICQTITTYKRPTEVRHPITSGWSEADIPHLSRMAETVHRHGSLLVSQPWCVHLWRPSDDAPEDNYGPSDIALGVREAPYVPMTIDDIDLLKRQIVNCAAITQRAGFDGVEVMAGVGGILNRFLSLATNNRTDGYGGSLENRARLTLETIQAIKDTCGKDFTVTVRWSPVEYVKGGVDKVEESYRFAQMIEEAGADLHNLSIGWHETSIPLTIKEVPDGYWSWVSEKIKTVAKKPVATAYRETDPKVMEDILRTGKADLIAGLRYLIADPFFARKVCEDRPEDINKCIGCCRCLDDVLGKGKPLNFCGVNPRLGPELDEPLNGQPAKKKKVVVVGSGMAGLEAAVVASDRGHEVTLVEKAPRIGGCNVLSAVFSPTYERVIDHFKKELAKRPDIKVKLRTPADASLVRSMNPDAVIVAVGGEAMSLDVPGADGKNTVQSHYILEMINGTAPHSKGMVNVFMYHAAALFLRFYFTPAFGRFVIGKLKWPMKQSIAVIGGGLPGCELAKLMMEHKRDISIIDEHKKIGWDVGSSDRFHIVSAFKKADNVDLYTLSKPRRIVDDGVFIETEDGGTRKIDAASVVIALGFEENRTLYEELKGVVDEVYEVGDCKKPARMADATKDGYVAACSL